MFIQNSSGQDIIEYPFNFQKYTLLSGQTTEVPDDAGKYLLKVYGFLSKGAAPINTSDPVIAKIVEKIDEIVEEKKESVKESIKYDSMSYRDLQKLYTETTGTKSVGKKKAELVAELQKLNK